MNESAAKSSNWSSLFVQIQDSVIAGQHQHSRALFDQIIPRQIPREWAYRFAQLANRIHQSIFSLKAMHRFIFPENLLKETTATDEEKMIYGYALLNLGAVDESLQILTTINSQANPEALFIRSMANFRKWNYADSLPLLKHYISNTQLDPYRRLVGEVNLVAASICLFKCDKVPALIENIQLTCKEKDYKLLLGNSYELQAQYYFFQERYDDAIHCLNQAAELLRDQQGLYLLFVEKWSLLCACFKANTKENLQKLQDLRHKAKLLGEWETIRECDLFEAILTENEMLLKKVIMGTPSELYRHRARQLFKKDIKPQGHIFWEIQNAKNATVTDFNPYEKRNGQTALFEKPHLLALFEALTLDFYKPAHLGALFKSVYPTEKFNPFTSPARVMRLLKRLDDWFLSQQVALRVEFKKSEFHLVASSPVRILIQRGQKLTSRSGRWTEIKSSLQGRTFTSSKISELTGISIASAQRLIKSAVNEGLLTVRGKGPNTAYQFSLRKKLGKAA